MHHLTWACLSVLAVAGCLRATAGLSPETPSDGEPRVFDAGGASTSDASRDAGDGNEATDAGPSDIGLDGGPEPASDAGNGAIAATYQIDPAHTGWQPNGTVRLPLVQRWAADLGGSTSYAVAAGGRVFATAHKPSGDGTTLWALEASTGHLAWGPVSLTVTHCWSALAYDNGRVFAVSFDGMVRAFDANSGALLWSTSPGQYVYFTSAPTATNGKVFISGGGNGGAVYALDQISGAVIWFRAVEGGDRSSPAVGPSGVFVSYSCIQAWGFSPTGTVLWHHDGPCAGSPGDTTVLFNGRIYTRDYWHQIGNLILDDSSGHEVGTHSSVFIPAFSSGILVETKAWSQGGSVSAIALDGGNVVWTYPCSPRLAPIVVGAQVIIACADGVVALDVNTGNLVSSAALSGIAVVDEDSTYSTAVPLAGLTAAEGLLFVPTTTGLVAY